MVEIRVEIMHAPWNAERRVWVWNLLRQTAEFQPHVTKDTSHVGVWPTARRAWLRLAITGATHGVLLQDDVAAVDGFADLLRGAVEARPDAALALWHNKPFAHKVKAAGQAWFTASSGLGAPGLVLPRAWIVPFLHWNARWVKDHWGGRGGHDDTRLQLWLAAHNKPLLYTVPSLVAHLGNQQSTMGHTRESPPIIVAPDGPVDWSAGAEQPMHDTSYPHSYVAFSWPRARARKVALEDTVDG